jgi:hypothetical protein
MAVAFRLEVGRACCYTQQTSHCKLSFLDMEPHANVKERCD